MGSYVSRYECEGYHNVTLNCTIDYTDSTNTSLLAIGDIQKGEFEGDPDISGVGIFATFLAVSGTALLCSVLDLSWRLHKFIQVKRKHKTKHTHLAKLPGPTDFLEAVVQSCSDTQVFTGAAYAITLRYFRGCSITAYHYNIVANMMLLTCATHLMSITVVKDYWKYPWLALVRVLAITGVFLVTGMLLANQNADIEELPFPTKVPPGNETDSYLFMTAACFQSGDAQLLGTLNSSFANGAEGFEDAIFESKPGNKIEGWNKFLVMLLWYGAALLVEIFSFFRRGARRGGKRSKVTKFVSRGLHRFVRVFFPCAIRKEKKTQASVEYTPLNSPNATESKQLVSSPLGSTRDSVTSGHPAYHFPGQSQPSDSIDTDHEEIVMFKSLRNFGHGVHFLYMGGGAGICIWTVVVSAQYMIQLRYWVQRSGWLARDGQGVLAEEDPTTFGQLVPICMSGLILFSIVEMLSRLITRHKDIKYNRLTHSPEEGNGRIYRPSTGTISEAFESTRPESTRPTLHHYSKVHSSSISSPPVGSTPDTPTPFSDHSTLL